MEQFKFYQGLDVIGHDIDHLGDTAKLPSLVKFATDNKDCVAFNTFGWMKRFVPHESKFVKCAAFNEAKHGLYVHKERYEKLMREVNNQHHIMFEDYDFYPGLDSFGNDIGFEQNKTILELKNKSDEIPNCLGFNTYGYLKSKIAPIKDFIKLNNIKANTGLYVKKQFYRVKLLCNWTSSKNLCEEWNHMSKGNMTWNDIKVTWEDNNIDLYVIINKPYGNEHYVPHRTIVFQMEPWCGDSNQNWGVKTWGEWARPSELKFLQVRSHDKFINNGMWQLSTTYSQFKTEVINKSDHSIISSICSSKYFDPGHIKRIDFLKFIESKNDSNVQLHIYNNDNEHNFKSYQGPHPPGLKDKGIKQYKYYFMPENNVEHNFITEKMYEPLLCETLCFYWGCPNVTDYFNPLAFIQLDLNDFEKSFNIIRDAIINDEWSKRLEYIRAENQKVLEYFNFFPTLERIIKHDFKLGYRVTDEEILYQKHFRNININYVNNNVCFIHSCTINNNTEILCKTINLIGSSGLIKKLDKIIVVNTGSDIDYDYKESDLAECDALKIVIINYSRNTQAFEIPTINLLGAFAKRNSGKKVLYLHTKGVSYGSFNNQSNMTPLMHNINDWCNYMLYFLVEQHRWCLDLLGLYDAVGCNFHLKPKMHFSGNFWYATTDYLSKLNQITTGIKHDCEWWLLSNPDVNYYSVNDTNIDHYQNPYPVELYHNPQTLDRIQSFYDIDPLLRIKCINLKRRPDRKAGIIDLMDRSDVDLVDRIDFFEAIDGTQLEATEEIVNMFKGNDFGNRRTFIGCALSHFTLLKELVQDPVYDKYLILEDDIQFVDGFRFKLNETLKQTKLLNDDACPKVTGYDALYLGNTIYRHNLHHYDRKLEGLKGIKIIDYDTTISIGGLFGYIVTKSGAAKFIKFIEENGIKHGIDYLMFHYEKEMDLKHYEVLPRLIVTDYVDFVQKVDSDIQYDQNKLF